jgi:hypothetical protein
MLLIKKSNSVRGELLRISKLCGLSASSRSQPDVTEFALYPEYCIHFCIVHAMQWNPYVQCSVHN